MNNMDDSTEINSKEVNGKSPEHATPEMLKLIKEFSEAKQKDDEIVSNFRKRQQRAKEAWLRRSEEERQELTASGKGFEDLPDPPSKWVRNFRRGVRYSLFRIRDGKSKHDGGLKKWIEMQFRQGMNWSTFTFEWDVSCKEPLKVIEPMEWDGRMILDQFSKRNICDPAAFTKQEV